MDQKTRTATTTTVATLTRADVRAAIHSGRLSDEEERCVRMRFGISEPGETKLSRRGADFPETRAQLAMMEAGALTHLAPPIPMNPLKQRIIAKLKKTV